MARITATHFIYEMRLLRDEVASFETYPFCLPAVRHLDVLAFHPSVTFLIGENGSGKSTLLESIAVASGLNTEGGSRNFNFTTRDSLSPLHEAVRLVKGISQPKDSFFLRSESFFNVATEIERIDPSLLDQYGGRSLHEQSHGKSFMTLFQNRFRGKGLYILDEPEAALSPTRQMGFLAVMHDLIRRGSQFIIATHSPIIMAYPQSWIYVLQQDGIQRAEYEETEHYKITRYFLNNTRKMLTDLLGG